EIPRTPGFQLRPRSEFQITVPGSQFERAKELLGIQIAYGEEAEFDEAEIQAAMELPVGDDLPVDEIREDSHPSAWYPEDATREIWNGNARKPGETIELSLRENSINFRSEPQHGGQLRIFVMPEDETKAREIAREIVEGIPPE